MDTVKNIFFIILIFLACRQKTFSIKDTKDYIVFDRESHDTSDLDDNIWLINVITRKEIQLTNFKDYLEQYPIWISDSELVYSFTKATPFPVTLVYVNLNTGNVKNIPTDKWKQKPALTKISSDGRYNIYYSSSMKNNTVYTIPLKEKYPMARELITNIERARFGLAIIYHPIVSPDNTKLMFYACDTAKWRYSGKPLLTNNCDLYIYNLNVNADTILRLTDNDSTYSFECPIWIDNRRIVYVSNMTNNYELYLMNIDTKKSVQLTYTDDADEGLSTVSPDKKHIAYTKWFPETNKNEIWVMDLDTKDTWYLTEGFAPDWSPAQ